MIGKIIETIARLWFREDLEELGKTMFVMATQEGFPPEFCMDEFVKRQKLSTEERVMIVHTYQTLMMEHKIKAGMIESGVKRQQKTNCKQIAELYQTGEFQTL